MAFSSWCRRSFVLGMLLSALAVTASACAAPEDDIEDQDVADDEAALTSPAVRESDMSPVPRPAGMPGVWNQPDSEGIFDERGKCGPTAVANTLRLYGVEVSPDQAYEDGVSWWIGSRDIEIRDYLLRRHARLGCTIENPEAGGRFLRDSLAASRPVMVWFRTGGLNSHWVVVVGRQGSGANEKIIVMSWGRYYTIPMNKFLASWRNVYGARNPAVVCDTTTSRMVR